MRLRVRISTIGTSRASSSAAAASAAFSTRSASSNAPELVQRLAEQQPGLGRDALERRRPAEPLDLGEVVAVAGQPGGLEQQGGVGRPGRLEPRGRHTDRVLPSPAAVGVDAVGVLEQEAPPREHRHRGPQDLAVERVGQR